MKTICCQSVSTVMVPPMLRLGVYGNEPRHALQIAANQAASGRVRNFAAAAYGERRFGLRALSAYQMALIQPTGSGAFGLQIAYSGDADFNASKVGFAYGRNLGERISTGVQFNYWNQHISGYGNAAQVTVEGGLLVRLSEAFQAGFQACNPVGVVVHKWDRKLPAVYTIGIGYQPSPHVSVTAELVKVAERPVAVQGGVEYRFAATCWAKAGINSSTAAFFIAAGFQLNGFSIEVAGSVHPRLGLSPGLLLWYNGMGK